MDGNHDDTTQALVESQETTEVTEERSEISSHQQENRNLFLSGTPLKGDQLSHQLSTTDVEESKAEDSSSQELVSPKGDSASVQDAESGETLDLAQDELQGSSDDKKTSEAQEETQMESGTGIGQQQAFLEKVATGCNAEQQGHDSSAARIHEQQSPYCEQQNSGSSVSEPQDGTPDSEQQETIALSQGEQDKPTDTEQQGILAPSQNHQERGVENEQQHSVALRQGRKDDLVTANEQQETKAPRQDQQGSPANNDQQTSAGPTEDQQGFSSPTTYQQKKPAGNEQQEAASLTQHQQDSPTDNEKQGASATQENEGDRAVGGLIETHELKIEENQPEEAQANMEEAKEGLSTETIPQSETIQAGSGSSAVEPKELDIANKSQREENILVSQDVNGKPNLEKPKEEVAKVEIAVENLQVSQAVIAPPDELHEENKKLKQEIVIMKQQEDAYRIKVLSLEQEVGKLRARKIDNRSQDSLASDSDSYLKQKLAETERELDTAERKVKDLQLRLKRFAKDDQLKDEKIFQMEKEVKEMSDHVKKLEQSLADSQKESNNNSAMQASLQKNDSKVCVIL